MPGDGKATREGDTSYCIRPNFQKKFRPAAAKQAMETILKSRLQNTQYDQENTPKWTKEIADDIREAMKQPEFSLDRYKFVVQVVIGEQRGEGVKMAARCFWDSDTDNFANATFMNDTLFCVATVYGIYYY